MQRVRARVYVDVQSHARGMWDTMRCSHSHRHTPYPIYTNDRTLRVSLLHPRLPGCRVSSVCSSHTRAWARSIVATGYNHMYAILPETLFKGKVSGQSSPMDHVVVEIGCWHVFGMLSERVGQPLPPSPCCTKAQAKELMGVS